MDEGRLMLFQVFEDRANFGRLHPALVVVERCVVRLVVVAVEAVDVAAAQVEVLAQRRQEGLEVVLRARVDPDEVGERRRTRHLGAQVGGDLPRLLPVDARDANEARLERVVRLLLLEVGEFVEQAPDLRRREALVNHTPERRHLLRAAGGAAWRHHRLLVPAEDGTRPRQVADLSQAAAQLLEGRSHGEEPYSTPRRVWLANSVAQSSNVARYSPRGGSMLVRRRIQTPSVANGPERGSTEGEVVLGASPPARPLLARQGALSDRPGAAASPCGDAPPPS